MGFLLEDIESILLGEALHLEESTEQFHVYHKVKGDRFGGPDYEHKSSHNTREEAEEARKKHEANIPAHKKKFHSVVVVGDSKHKSIQKSQE